MKKSGWVVAEIESATYRAIASQLRKKLPNLRIEIEWVKDEKGNKMTRIWSREPDIVGRALDEVLKDPFAKVSSRKKHGGSSVEGLISGLMGFLKAVDDLSQPTAEKDECPESALRTRPERATGAGRRIRPSRRDIDKVCLLDIFDEEKDILIVVRLPSIKEKDLDLHLRDNVLRVTLRTPTGAITKEITIPTESVIDEIEGVSFKNCTLQIRLKKKKAKKK